MCVLLQSMQTERYVAGADVWTEIPEKAQEFGEGVDAVVFCYQHHLAEMRILGQGVDAQRNFLIPLLVIHSM